MTTTEPMTQQEINIFMQFFKNHRIAWLGNDGDKNGTIFGQFFDQWMTSANRNIPFTQQTLDIAFKKLQEAGSLVFYSPDEAQYRIYEEQYPAELETIRKFLPSYRLDPTGENLFMNSNIILEYCISTNRVHQISRDTLESMMGNLINRPGVRPLQWAQTPNQQAAQKRWDKAKEADPPPTIKGLFEGAKLKAASVAHIVNPDGTRMSDRVMREFFERHPEAREIEAPTKTPQQDITDAAEAHWKQQTLDYIQSFQNQNQNLLHQEAQTLFGQPLHGSWRQAYNGLQIWHERKKLGIWGRS